MASLSTLRQKWRRRRRARRRQRKLGHRRTAARHGKAMRKLRGLIERVKRVVYSTRPGGPAWGGAAYIVRSEVRPIVKRAGYPVTSTKRWETYGNPSSDHYRGNRYAYAEDYGAGTNYGLAQKVREVLDGGEHVDYASFYIERRGHTYRCQIIAANHGTGPHLHVGCERVS